MTLGEFEAMVRKRPDGGDSVNLRLRAGRWELKVAHTVVWGATLDEVVDRAVEHRLLAKP